MIDQSIPPTAPSLRLAHRQPQAPQSAIFTGPISGIYNTVPSDASCGRLDAQRYFWRIVFRYVNHLGHHPPPRGWHDILYYAVLIQHVHNQDQGILLSPDDPRKAPEWPALADLNIDYFVGSGAHNVKHEARLTGSARSMQDRG